MGLHTSLFYFCCHTPAEVVGIKAALHNMPWHAFPVDYDSFACNLDHNNVTIYLHALPTNQSQLLALAQSMEAAVLAAGISINHPRKSLFHMTLARVNHTYPVDDVVRYFLANRSATAFGQLTLDEFSVDGEVYHPTATTTTPRTAAATTAAAVATSAMTVASTKTNHSHDAGSGTAQR